MNQPQTEGQAPALKPKTFFNTVHSTLHHYTENVNKIIKLRCIFGRQPQKLRLVPATVEGNDDEMLGVERLTPEQMKERNYVVTKKTKRIITDSHEFNLNNEQDRIDWNWVQYCKEIGLTRDESLYEHSEVSYFVDDEEGELNEKIGKRDLQFQAETLVRNLTPDERYDYARLMGNDMSLHKPNEVMEYMLDAASTSYAKLLSIDKDTYKTDRLLLLRLLDTGVIREENKAFYYQQIRIGLDESSALAYLLDSSKRDIVDQMKHEYRNKHRPAHGGSVPPPVRGMVAAVPQQNSGAMPVNPELQLALGQVERLAPLAWAQHFAQLSDGDRLVTGQAVGIDTLTALVQAETRNRLQATMAVALAPAAAPVSAAATRAPFTRIGGSGGIQAPAQHHLAGQSGGFEDVPAVTPPLYAAPIASELPVEDAFDEDNASTPNGYSEPIPAPIHVTDPRHVSTDAFGPDGNEELPIVNVIESNPSASFEDGGEPFRTAPVDHYTTSSPGNNTGAEPVAAAGGIPRKGGKFTAREKPPTTSTE